MLAKVKDSTENNANSVQTIKSLKKSVFDILTGILGGRHVQGSCQSDKFARYFLSPDAASSRNPFVVAQKLALAIERHEPIEFILPAFPAKSNNRNKTISALPDWGEIAALQALQSTCESISKIYSPGARVVVASDGRVFADVVGIDDKDVDVYRERMGEIISVFSLDRISTFSIEDVWAGSCYTQMRQKLDQQYGEQLDVVRRRCQQDPKFSKLYNGVHRFLFEDYLEIWQGLSRSQVRKRVKPLVYKTMSRSNAWSALVAEAFPAGVRLSIHPQSEWDQKLPVELVAARSGWATPWHNAPLVGDDGSIELVKAEQAYSRGAILSELSGYAVFSYKPIERLEINLPVPGGAT